MTETAYIVGKLDIRSEPPQLVSVSIHSASAQQLTTLFESEYMFDIAAVPGETFDEAVDRAEVYLRAYNWAWRIYEAPFLRREHERRK